MTAIVRVINPNSNPDVTVGMSAAIESLRMQGGPELDCVTLSNGPFGIENQADVKWFWDKENKTLKLSDVSKYIAEDISCYNALGQRLEIDISKINKNIELSFTKEHTGLHIISFISSEKAFTIKLIL